MPAGRPDRRVIALAVGVPAAILLVVVATAVVGGGSDDDDRATTTTTAVADPAVDERWDRALARAFEPLVDVLPEYARTVDAWSNGERTDAELAAALDEVEPVITSVADAAAALPEHRADDLAQPLVADVARLYVEAVSAHRAALAVDDAGLAEQWDRLGRRLRILADRAFDRARERTSAPFEGSEGIDLRLPAEVPDFDRLQLAVGPPLEPDETNVADVLPRLRADDRPSQSEAAWEEAVAALDVPTADDVRAALGDAGALAAQARRLVAAAEALRDEPVPDGDRGRADRVALGWLVLADAARAGQLEALGGVERGVADAVLDVASGAGLTAP